MLPDKSPARRDGEDLLYIKANFIKLQIIAQIDFNQPMSHDLVNGDELEA